MRFGYSNSIRGRVEECTPELLRQALDNPATASTCAEIEDALERTRRGEMSRDDFEEFKAERKKRLPILTPHAMFKSGRRLNSDAEPSGLSMYDIDHLSAPRHYYERLIKGRERELGVVMAHVTPSSEGLRLVFRVPWGMSLEEAQRWMSQKLGGDNYDGCVKDMARCSFLVPRDYVLFLDEEGLFETSPAPSKGGEFETSPAPSKGGEFRSAGVQECRSADTCLPREQTLTPPLEGTGEVSSLISHPVAPPSEGTGEVPSLIPHPVAPPSEGMGRSSEGTGEVFKSIPYTSIIAEYWRRTGGVPQEGERNKRLHQLAANLRAICDDSEERLLQLMPSYGLQPQEMRSIVHSACKEPTKGSKIMDEIVRDLTSPAPSEGGEPQSEGRSVGDLKKRLPIGLKESLVGVPEGMQMPVLCAVMPIAAAYADQVEVEYCDGNRQRLGLMSIIRGDQASGKSVCKNAVDVWKRQLDEEDALARKREDEWKERKKGRKASEKAPEDPKVLIRTVPVTVSCSTLLKRLKNSGGHTIYSFCEELDTLRKTNGAGSWSSKYDIYRLGFDHGEWGQDYNSDQAESGVVQVAYNWTMLGTNGAMHKCFKADNIENGLSSRILVAEMPDASFAKMPKFKRRSEDDEARIQEAVTLLRSQAGMVDTPRLRRAIEQWVEEKRVEAAKDIDRVKDTYRKRAAVIGFRCGVVFRLLEGRESNRCLEFALMMAEYCLQQQIAAFGEALQSQYVEAKSECQRYGTNHSVFDQLPPTFTIDDLRALKRGYCSDAAMRMIIFRWMRDGWITKTDRHHWSKTTGKSD